MKSRTRSKTPLAFRAAKRKEFDDLCAAVVGRQHRSIYGTQLSEKAQQDMEKVIAFTEANLGERQSGRK
jgi:hypothetical protein